MNSHVPLQPNNEELLCRSVGLLQAALEDGMTDRLRVAMARLVSDFKEVNHERLS